MKGRPLSPYADRNFPTHVYFGSCQKAAVGKTRFRHNRCSQNLQPREVRQEHSLPGVHTLWAKGRWCTPGSVERTATKLNKVELHPFDGDHFDVYHNPLRAMIVSEQLAFLEGSPLIACGGSSVSS